VAIAKSVNIPLEVLQQLADHGRVPSEQRKFYFESVRTNVRTAWELDQVVKRGLAGKKAESLAAAALALYDGLGNLNERRRALIQEILSSEAKFLFDRVAGSQLYISTVTAGGSLSLEKNIPTGSFVDAIDALARCLPEGFVPRPLPGSTIQRIKDACIRAEKQADDLGF